MVEHPSSALGAPGEPISSAIVKYNYQAQQLDELSLVKGARILILEKSGDGWWRGQCGNKVGWFPSNYTQVNYKAQLGCCGLIFGSISAVSILNHQSRHKWGVIVVTFITESSN